MFCCTNCFSEQLIKEFIEQDQIRGDCDYCGSEKVFVASVDEVGSFIMEGIDRAYEDPAEQVGYCTKEGGYLLPTTDVYDILMEEEPIFSERVGDQTKLLNALVPDTLAPYVQRDPYGTPPGDSDQRYYWEKFCRIVKTGRRYTAFYTDGKTDGTDLSSPTNFMQSIVTDITADYIGPIKKGTKIFRARIEKRGAEYGHKELTSPPPEKSRHNRMSPAGIPFFYGSLDEPETCIGEIRPSVGERVVVAEFSAEKDLFVLDLSQEIDEETSIFSENYSYSIERRKSFLRHFVADIARPIRPMDQEIDYIPTQIFTEFVRWWDFGKTYFWDTQHSKENPVYIQGIVFRSSLKENGKNIVLFRGPEISTEKNDSDKTWLKYERSKTYEVRRVDVKADKIKDND